MKFFAFVFLVTIAGARNPYNENLRWVTNDVIKSIQEIQRDLINAGLDPLEVKHLQRNLSIPKVLRAVGLVDKLSLNGLSNIAINHLNFTKEYHYVPPRYILGSIYYDISLPDVSLSVDNSSVNFGLFRSSGNASVSGSVTLKQVRITGDASIAIDPTFYYTIHLHDLDLDFSVIIKSELVVKILNHDVSKFVNSLLNVVIPAAIIEYQALVNSALGTALRELLLSIHYDIVNKH